MLFRSSRFSQTQTIFTTDKERAFDSMARFEERPLALEIVKQTTSGLANQNEKEAMPRQVLKAADEQVKAAELFDWTPVRTKIGLNL